MVEAGYLLEVIVVLLAAVISTLLFQRLGLGAVLGYLVAGTAIGPGGLALVSESESIRALAELGVVFLLFTVGLELPIERIKLLFWRIFALGTAQILVTALVIAGIALWAGANGAVAAVIGGALALSSTAIVLRMLSDRGELTSQFGRSAFGVLLVQDLAVAPFLVWVLALGQDQLTLPAALGFALLKMLVAVVAILGLGRTVLSHLFWQAASIRAPETFTALTLLIALATGWLAQLAGLSMAFGAFLAGMLLAGTNYRHQVAADILPFRGLLLGLFYMTIGMTVDLELVLEAPGTVVLLVIGLLLAKTMLIAGLARLLGFAGGQALHMGLLLSQGGEFSFLLLGAALTVGILPHAQLQLLVLAVVLTMMATPLLAQLGRVVERRAEQSSVVPADAVPETTEVLQGHVVIAGFGRVGTAVAAHLEAAGQPFIAIDLDPHRVAQAQQRSRPVFYGDATRAEILAAIHVERARSVVVALDNPKAALTLVALLNYIFPGLKVHARARDESHARELELAGAHAVVPEMVAAGVRLAGSILEEAPELGPEDARSPDQGA
jgi:CPA2 family monovalent cation:H+ antiporter-2